MTLSELILETAIKEAGDIGDVRLDKAFAEGFLEMLKEQEPVEPKEEHLNDVDSIYRCGNCGTHFYYRQQKYCAICGRMAKWG